MSSHKGEKMDLFGGGDLASLDNEIYGGQPNPEIPDSGRVVARPTSILSIWADRKQPRRAIPSSIAMHWNGDPNEVPALLGKMHLVAEQSAGVKIDVVHLLNGEGEGIDSDKFPSVAQEYLSLVRLAQGIKADGLINPITVVVSDDKLLIESGERRWLAYHLLNTYLGETWAKIPAAKSSGSDSVWRQATENTQRRQLNAIGMARQIALLIMAARGTPPISEGTPYQEYEDMVKAGVSDRRFYAQVADGNVHRIPRGMGERIQGAMGLGTEQISQYRALLHLTNDEQVNDVIWTRADIENWSEKAMREIATLTAVKVRDVIERANWTLDDLRALKDMPVSKPSPFNYPPAPGAEVIIPRRPVTSEWMNKRVITKGNLVGTVVSVDGDRIVVWTSNLQRQSFHYTELTLMGDRPSPAATTPAPQPSMPTFVIGDTVRTRTGSEGVVTSISGRLIGVKTANGYQNHDPSLLMKIEKAKPQPVEATEFVLGDKVSSTYGRKGGVVVGFLDGSPVVLFPGSESFAMKPNDLVLVEHDERVPQINEENIEEDVDPDAPAPVREWREGWTDGEGGNNELASDKANSVVPLETVLILKPGSRLWSYVSLMQQLANLVGDTATFEMMRDMVGTTNVKVKTMKTENTLHPALNQVNVALKAAMDTWHMSEFSEVLRAFEDAAE